MDRSYAFLPTYTGDVSGVCSALFELGGMVVIHDPSGCNSTYNTHDETRWYDQDSLIFITGLIERDAILGNDEKLVADVVSAANELSPRFIALVNSPIPFISGTDLPALARLIEQRCNIPAFYVPTNGMHDYVVGAGRALATIAERFVHHAPKRPHTMNVLGLTPLDFGIRASRDSFASFAARAGFDLVSCWAMGDTLDDLSRAAAAEVNLVVSATGLPAAQVLRTRFGTPYVAGIPLAGHEDELAAQLSEAADTSQCLHPCRYRNEGRGHRLLTAIGEPVTMGSVVDALARKLDCQARLICPLEVAPELLATDDLLVRGEDALVAATQDSSLIVADALYAPLCPAGARLIPLSHQALSGRNSWKGARDLCGLDVGTLREVARS